MLKLKRFKIEKRYTVKLFYISQKFKRGLLLPSIHVDTLKLKKRRVLKKRNNFSRAGNRTDHGGQTVASKTAFISRTQVRRRFLQVTWKVRSP